MAWMRAVKTDHMYSTERNTIYVPFTLEMRAKKAKERALLDSGATHNFMDRRMVKRLGLGMKKLWIPRTIRNVD